MEIFSRMGVWRRQNVCGMSESAELEEVAAVQAAGAEVRGGGERGSIELTESFDPGRGTSNSKLVEAETVMGAGSTKMTGASAGRSGLWQHDMLHCVMVSMLRPQSMACSGPEGICEL